MKQRAGNADKALIIKIISITAIRDGMILDYIYDAAIDEAAFAVLPENLSAAVGARSMTLSTYSEQHKLLAVDYSYFDKSMMERFVVDDLSPHDLWGRFTLSKSRPGRVLSMDDHISPLEFKNSFIFNELLKPYGDDSVHCLAASFTSDTNKLILGLQRGDRAQVFSESEINALKILTPHLTRVFTLRGRLARAATDATAFRHALDRMPVAFYRLDRKARVIFMNASAERLSRARDGVAVRHDRLRLDTPAAQTALDHAIAQASNRIGEQGSGLRAPRRSYATSYRIVVSPGGPERDGSCIVLIDDPAVARPGVESMLASIFGLTGAEATLAIGLIEGLTPEEVAQSRNIRVSTVRTQVRSLLAKTDRRRLTDVVMDFSRVAAMTGPDEVVVPIEDV